jgi:hypothetical protein
LVKHYLAKNNVTTLEHPPYSWPSFWWFLPVLSNEVTIEGTTILWCSWHD